MMRWLALAIVLAVASPVMAQPAGRPGQGQQAAPQDRREKIKKRIRALRAYTLTEELSLDEQTAGKLFPMLARYDDEFDKLLVARVDIERRLVDSSSSSDSKAADKVVEEAAANQKALWDTETKRLAELRKILTPQQVARTLVVLPKMERQIQNQMRKAARATRRKADAADDEDVDLPRPKQVKSAKKAPPVEGTDPGARKTPPCDPFSSFHGCK